MTDKNIARMVAKEVFKTHDPAGSGFAMQLFVERMAIPKSVEQYSRSELESYIRDALKRGVDVWDIYSPAQPFSECTKNVSSQK